MKLAARYGVHRTAKALRVGYYSLKKRAQQEAGAAGEVAGVDAGATFFEWAPAVQVGPCEWTLEFAAASGAKMRLHFKGVEPPDLTALGRGFWQVES